ncbi:MAG TPA: glycosyltransferase family 39 protein [Thermoanaerobaculia bacterium]|nr:glycosyltransferase family 39 protein [Thermoanaerobaculia bacterium]
MSWAWLLAVPVVLALFLGGLGRTSLVEPDEGRYADIPSEMLASGDLVTPRLNGVLYFEKPPLYYWLEAAAMRLVGRNETAARLPSALLGLAGLSLAYGLGRSLAGRQAGATAALLAGTAPLYLVLARVNTIDMTASFFLSLTLACFWWSHRRPDAGKRQLLWLATFAAAGLAVMSKGLIGVVLPGGIIAAYVLATWQWRLLRQVPWLAGPLVFLAVAAPWHLVMARRHPSFLWFYFVHEHFLRYATPEAGRWQPAWFFLPVLAVGLLPWSGLVVAAAPLSWKGDPARRRGAFFLALWALVIVAFFSASQSKLATYVLPAVLPLAVLGALALAAAREAERPSALLRWGTAAGALLFALLAAAGLWVALGRVPKLVPPGAAGMATVPLAVAAVSALAGVVAAARGRRRGATALLAVAAACWCGALVLLSPLVGERRSADRLADLLRRRLARGAEVVAFGGFPESLGFYLQRRIPLVSYHGELDWGASQLSQAERRRYFPSTPEFLPRWRSPQPTYLVVKDALLRRMRAEGIEPGPLLGEQGGRLLFANPAAAAAGAAAPPAAGSPP